MIVRHLTRCAVPALTLAAVLAGCGSGGSTGGGTGPAPAEAGSGTGPASAAGGGAAPARAATSDPCRLLSQAEVSRLLGTAYGPGRASTGHDGPMCSYGARRAPIVAVVATRYHSMDVILAGYVSAGKIMNKKVTSVAVSGVGDEAHYAPALSVLSVLYKGDVYCVTVAGSHDDRTASVAVAKVVLSHAG